MKYDGMRMENAPKFQKTKVVEIMLAIDPDTGSDDPEVPPDTPGTTDGDYVALEPDVADVADLSGILSFDVAKKLIHDGPADRLATRRLPARWRGDTPHSLDSTMESTPSRR